MTLTKEILLTNTSEMLGGQMKVMMLMLGAIKDNEAEKELNDAFVLISKCKKMIDEELNKETDETEI